MISQVNIGITTHNRIEELIYTINWMKRIGFKENQFFIVDDCSEDNTTHILNVRFPEITVLSNNKKKGVIWNRNWLWYNTSKEFLLFLDDDSHILSEEDVNEGINVLNSNPNFGVFAYETFNSKEAPPEKSQLKNDIYLRRNFIACGCIFKRTFIRDLNYYSSPFLTFYGEELDCSLRAFKKGYLIIGKKDLIAHHRINLKERRLNYKKDRNYWRYKTLISGELLIICAYYPLGLDFVFIIYRIMFFMKELVKSNAPLALFYGLRIVTNEIKSAYKLNTKLSVAQFLKWRSFG